jgi:polar amino acid transport system substrate-binding protein
MASVPDSESSNRHHPGRSAPDRIVPPDQKFVELNCKDSSSPELSEVLDVKPIQFLMNDFYAFSHIPMAVLDISGKVLAGVGWQEICTDFHRANADSCRNCVESDVQLSKGVPPGEYRLYKCKNNMWDVATPLVIGEHHVGNIFSGQFFFEDEEPDRELFRAQARTYGFDEAHYLAALAAVPRLSRDTLQTGMAFMTKLAHLISDMSYKNAQMAQWMEERRRSEEALIRSEKLASVGRMAATVAHEINNPLEAVTNCIYLAKSDADLAPRIKEHLDVAEQELLRVAHITRQTLGFYRENGKPSVVDVDALVHEVSELYGPKLRQKELRLKVEHEGESRIIAVAGEIRQVISNLLTNAIDACPSRHRVRIRTSRVTLNGCSHARLTIADTGSGICRNLFSQLFKPFFTTKEAVGTGLGLWVSNEIVTKHGGRIRLHSVEGKGTVFSVFLPQQNDVTKPSR